MKKVYINTDFITITQFLKIEGYISSGGEAKYYLANNKVYHNNELEVKRGKKLYPKDIIKIKNFEYIIVNEN